MFFTQQAAHGLRCSAGFNTPIHTHFFRWAIFTLKVGHTDLVFGVRSGFISRSVHLCRQDYKSLCSTVTICSIMVNIQRHTQTALWSAYLISSASWANDQTVIWLNSIYKTVFANITDHIFLLIFKERDCDWSVIKVVTEC